MYADAETEHRSASRRSGTDRAVQPCPADIYKPLCDLSLSDGHHLSSPPVSRFPASSHDISCVRRLDRYIYTQIVASADIHQPPTPPLLCTVCRTPYLLRSMSRLRFPASTFQDAHPDGKEQKQRSEERHGSTPEIAVSRGLAPH